MSSASAQFVLCGDFNPDLLVWSKQGITQGVPKLAYFHYEDKNFYMRTPIQRIAYTPKPLAPIVKPGEDASKKLPKYTLPIVAEELTFFTALNKLDARIIQLVFDRKDMLFTKEEAKKIKSPNIVEEFYYKSILYLGEKDGEERKPLLNAKLPLNSQSPDDFAVMVHVMNEDDCELGLAWQKVELTRSNLEEHIRGGAKAECLIRVKGIAMVNTKIYPMIDVSHIILHPALRDELPEGTEIYVKEEVPETMLLDAVLANVRSHMDVPKLERQTNEERPGKRTRK